jgi:hypothetical protein
MMFSYLEPRSYCAGEIQRREFGLQMIPHGVDLKKHFTAITPKPRIITIEFRKLKFGKGSMACEIILGKGVGVHTRDRAWRLGTQDPAANIPVLVFLMVPAGPLPG